MMTRTQRYRRLRAELGLLFGLTGFFFGCTSNLEIEVRLIDPCDKPAVSSVDFIRIEPRGTGLDSIELTTIERVDAFETAPIEVPLVADFSLVASGHRNNFDAPASAMGVSSAIDLTEAEGTVTLNVPFSVLGQFYRTTNLDAAPESPDRCSSLGQDRFGATATVLPGGQVLIVGGAKYTSDGFLEFPRLVEVYDPARGVFLDGPPDSSRKWELRNGQARRNHTANLLPDGTVLVTGGQAPDPSIQGSEIALRSAFIIDPRDLDNLEISEGGIAMLEARTGHRSAALADGRVVLVGGRTLNPTDNRIEAQTYLASIEIYQPSERAFLLATDAVGNAVRLAESRFGHSAQAIPGGSDVIVTGGLNQQGPVTSVEVLRLVPGVGATVTRASEALGVGAIDHASSLTQEGAILLSGGYATLNDVRSNPPTNSLRTVEVWAVDAMSGEASKVCSATLLGERGRHTSSVVAQRAVFIGGRGVNGLPRNDGEVADLLTLAEAGSLGNCFAQSPGMQLMSEARAEHTSATLPNSREVLIVGGVTSDPGPSAPGVSTAQSEIFSDFARRALLSSPTD